MKRLRYKTKKDNEIPIQDLPSGFTPTHTYTYTVKKGKLKPHKHKLTNHEINKLKNEREES